MIYPEKKSNQEATDLQTSITQPPILKVRNPQFTTKTPGIEKPEDKDTKIRFFKSEQRELR